MFQPSYYGYRQRYLFIYLFLIQKRNDLNDILANISYNKMVNARARVCVLMPIFCIWVPLYCGKNEIVTHFIFCTTSLATLQGGIYL